MKWIGKEVMTAPILGSITYVHVQSSSSDTWVITHDLGRFPSVTVIDSGGSVLTAAVTYNSENQLTITFLSDRTALATTGKAYLN